MCLCTYKNFVFVRSYKGSLGKENPPWFSLRPLLVARPCPNAVRFMTRTFKEKAAYRTRRLIVRLNDEEQTRLRANAQKAGLRVSEYVRRMAVEGHVVVRQQSGYGMALASQLRRVGVNLNQLTRLANFNGEVPSELAQVCIQLQTILDRVIGLE